MSENEANTQESRIERGGLLVKLFKVLGIARPEARAALDYTII